MVRHAEKGSGPSLDIWTDTAADRAEVRGQRDLEDDMRPRTRLYMCCVGASSCMYTYVIL